MPSQTYSYTSSTFSSSTSSSYNGQTTRQGQAYQKSTHADPSGKVVQTTSQNLGEPAVQETRYFDGEGRQVLEDGRTIGPGSTLRADVGRVQAIEDVQDGEGGS